jgi:transcriptional regulator with XRE-family HTH domain
MEKETARALEAVRAIRKKKKVSILKLAIEVGIARSHLYYIETKKVIPSVDILVKIAKALDTPPQDFFNPIEKSL